MDLGATILAFIVTVCLKVPVMAVATVLLYRMYRTGFSSRPERRRPPIPEEYRRAYKVLFLSLAFFLLSEIFCGIETYILMHSHPFGRFLHSASSSTGMGLFALGLYMLLDEKVIHFGRGRCVGRQTCRTCTLIPDGPCRFSASIQLAATFVMLAALPPFFATTAMMAAETSKFALPSAALNGWYEQTFLPLMKSAFPRYTPVSVAIFLDEAPQVLDYKILPAIALGITVVGIFLFRRSRLTQKFLGLSCILFAFGMLAYTYFELILYRIPGDLFIGAVGHELGELFFLVLLGEVLTTFFLPPSRSAEPARRSPGT